MASKIFMSMVEGLVEALAPLAAGTPEVGDYLMSHRSTKTKYLKCDGGAYSRTTYAALFAQIGTTFGVGDGSTTFNVPDPRGRALVIAGAGTLAESFAASAVTVATDLITVQSNVDRWITGMKVRATTTGVLPTGLALATDYFVIRIDATTIKLASSLANALAGTAIDLTAQGSGTHTLTHGLTARAVGEKGGEEAHAMAGAENGPHNHGVTHNAAAQYSSGSSGTGGATTFYLQQAATISTQSNGSGTPHNNMPPFLAVGNLFIYAGV